MLLRLPERRITSRPNAVRRTRRLPIEGEIHVAVGDHVVEGDTVGNAKERRSVLLVPAAAILGIAPKDLDRHLRRKPGDAVRAGDVIAARRTWPHLWKQRVCQAPVAGTILEGPPHTGDLFLLPAEVAQDLRAHIRGHVAQVTSSLNIVIETNAIVVTGVTGFGGEIAGVLQVIGSRPDATLDAVSTTRNDRAFSLVAVVGTASRDQLLAAQRAGVAAVVVGSVSQAVYDEFRRLGRLPIVVLEGFGSGGMSPETFDLLRSREGHPVSVSATERWPELILPSEHATGAPTLRPVKPAVGSLVRVIGREAGQLGRIAELGPAYKSGPFGTADRWVEVAVNGHRERVDPSVLEVVDDRVEA